MTHISPKAPHSLSIAAAQINTKVGDVAGNIGKIIDAWKKAEAEGADLVVTPELSMTGYPLEDLVLRVAAMVHAHPQIVDLDCNPVSVSPERIVILDARVRVAAPPPAVPWPSLDAVPPVEWTTNPA